MNLKTVYLLGAAAVAGLLAACRFDTSGIGLPDGGEGDGGGLAPDGVPPSSQPDLGLETPDAGGTTGHRFAVTFTDTEEPELPGVLKFVNFDAGTASFEDFSLSTDNQAFARFATPDLYLTHRGRSTVAILNADGTSRWPEEVFLGSYTLPQDFVQVTDQDSVQWGYLPLAYSNTDPTMCKDGAASCDIAVTEIASGAYVWGIDLSPYSDNGTRQALSALAVNDRLYVGFQAGNAGKVAIINPVDDSIESVIALGCQKPRSMVMDEGASKVLVACEGIQVPGQERTGQGIQAIDPMTQLPDPIIAEHPEPGRFPQLIKAFRGGPVFIRSNGLDADLNNDIRIESFSSADMTYGAATLYAGGAAEDFTCMVEEGACLVLDRDPDRKGIYRLPISGSGAMEGPFMPEGEDRAPYSITEMSEAL